MAMVVDRDGKYIIDARHGKPFLDDPRQMLGKHLVKYQTMPLRR